MWLINVRTYELEPFTDFNYIEYVALSHTWATDPRAEVTFQDIQDLSKARSKTGFAKIESTCQQAQKDKVDYAWIDTCCIDKSSTAELSEAINSMFRWYKDCKICYALLSDLEPQSEAIGISDLKTCKWFTRGWTLQELIAPKNLVFYDKAWKCWGTKARLKSDIEFITKIDKRVLGGSLPVSMISLATRMSWASRRQTTRVEDLSYCLFGIFDVNMPLIYGEGAKAFIRLQEELLKKATDLSLLAWQTKAVGGYAGLLATEPSAFKACGSINPGNDQFSFREEIALTNKGIKLKATIQPINSRLWKMDLHCNQDGGKGKTQSVGIHLVRNVDIFLRADADSLFPVERLDTDQPQTIHLAVDIKNLDLSLYKRFSEIDRIQFVFLWRESRYGLKDIRGVPAAHWSKDIHSFSLHSFPTFIGFVRFRITSSNTSKPNEDGDEDESVVAVLNMTTDFSLRVSLGRKKDFQNHFEVRGFINPFTDIATFGPFADPHSLSLLYTILPKNRSEVLLTGSNGVPFCKVRARVEVLSARAFKVLINIGDVDGGLLTRS